MIKGVKKLLEERRKAGSAMQVGFYFTLTDDNYNYILETLEEVEAEGILAEVFFNFQCFYTPRKRWPPSTTDCTPPYAADTYMNPRCRMWISKDWTSSSSTSSITRCAKNTRPPRAGASTSVPPLSWPICGATCLRKIFRGRSPLPGALVQPEHKSRRQGEIVPALSAARGGRHSPASAPGCLERGIHAGAAEKSTGARSLPGMRPLLGLVQPVGRHPAQGLTR